MTGLRAVLLPVGDEVYAIAIDIVEEVVVAPKVTVLPTAPPAVLGVLNVRGSVLPILDSGLLLRGTALGTAAFAVVVRSGTDAAALVASRLPAVVDLDEAVDDLAGEVQPPPAVGTHGVYLVGDQLITVFDPATLLAHAGLGSDPRAAVQA